MAKHARFLYSENDVCVVVDGQAVCTAVAESRLPQSVLEKLEQVCLIFDCTATFHAPFTALDLDTLGALVSLKQLRIAVILRTSAPNDMDAACAAMRQSLGSLLALVLQRVPSNANVEFGVVDGSAEARLVEQVRSMRQKSFRKEQRISVINVSETELKQKAVLIQQSERGSRLGLVPDVYAEYRTAMR